MVDHFTVAFLGQGELQPQALQGLGARGVRPDAQNAMALLATRTGDAGMPTVG